MCGGKMEIRDIILALQENGIENNCRLYFTRKKNNNSYASYSPLVDLAISKQLITLVSDYLEKQKDLPTSIFSPIGSYDETIEYCEAEEIQNFQEVIGSLQEDKVERENIPKKEINKLNFYCLSVDCIINGQEENIKFFRRITRFRKLSSKGMFGWIQDNRFSKMDTDILGVDGNIDVIVVGNDIMILNHIALERIFSMNDQYIEKSEEAIARIEQTERIENFEQFREDCQGDKRIVRILTKLLNEEDMLDHCFENFENVKKAINIFELDIKTSRQGDKETVVYENKNQLMDMVRLIRDSYYKSIIRERPGVDDSI